MVDHTIERQVMDMLDNLVASSFITEEEYRQKCGQIKRFRENRESLDKMRVLKLQLDAFLSAPRHPERTAQLSRQARCMA